MEETEVSLLHQLARLYGIEISYYDGRGCLRRASEDSLLAVLMALGAPVNDMHDIESALREHQQEQWRRCSEPVVVVWDRECACLEFNLPADRADSLAECELKLEYGEVYNWKSDLSLLPVLQAAPVEGTGYVVKQLELPYVLPWGYHRFRLLQGPNSWDTLIICAPSQAYGVDRIWGGFLPLYSIQSRNNWGSGDFLDLKALLNWLQDRGGSVVGTLPLLATYMDKPFDPSPYSPVSRLFWNEFYINAAAVPELERCPQAQSLLNSSALQKEIEVLRSDPLVNYRRGMAVKRKVLEELGRCCFAGDGVRQEAIRRWTEEYPGARDYARFRAAAEKQLAGWPAWPQRMQEGMLRQSDYDPEVERYHLYIQWVAREQLRSVSTQPGRQGSGLYLDLPLGVNGGGYDVWREQASFALDVSTGAPPDSFFTSGQDWGFPPLHPQKIRKRGYRYYVDCLRNHMQYAGILRLDHVAGLHRLFWIPRGHGAENGVYVRYRAEEFYAVLALESHRHKTALVGEDLGTVPDQVRTEMEQHNIYRMYILPFQQRQDQGLNHVPRDSLVSLNTHDMPPFNSFWAGQSPDERKCLACFLNDMGVLEPFSLAAEDILKASLKFLASSSGRILMVNMEDLWLETASQNVPGTLDEHPNWRRKARCSLDDFSLISRLMQITQELERLRGNTRVDNVLSSGGGKL